MPEFYVMPHDDEDVRWVVNTAEDVEQDVADRVDQMYGEIEVAGHWFHPSEILQACDRALWCTEYLNPALDSYTRVRIPVGVVAVHKEADYLDAMQQAGLLTA